MSTRALPGLPAGVVPPPEITDPDHVVWADGPAFRAWMAARGWGQSMPARDRVHVVDPELVGKVSTRPPSPARRRERREAAGRAWASEAGLDMTYGGAG